MFVPRGTGKTTLLGERMPETCVIHSLRPLLGRFSFSSAPKRARTDAREHPRPAGEREGAIGTRSQPQR